MTPEILKRALRRTEEGFLAAPGAEPLLARREAGRARADDAALAADYAEELRSRQLPGGSWDEDLVVTAESLELLLELEAPAPGAEPDAAVKSALDWLRRRQGGPGRFGDGCTPERHALGACNHFLGGFFAPGRDGAVMLGCGAVLPAGPAALLGASCVALRSLLRCRVAGPDVVLHLEGLDRLLRLDPRDVPELVPPDVVPVALSALLAAPPTPETDELLSRGLDRLVRSQRADGSWPDLDAFYILEILLAAASAGRGSEALDAAVRRGAGMLAVTQHADGTWDREPATRRTRIGWRALHYAVALEEARA
ncbi:MAG TPA: hypothetical protein VF188_12765 [Longimicrobiales bacterium]